MNEAETRAELIDPLLTKLGWGLIEDTKVLREFHITAGKINASGGRGKPTITDYILTYKNIKLAVIEAKSDELPVGEGVAQAKDYAEKLKIDFTYSSNGKEIYQINMKTGIEELVATYPTPDELWNMVFQEDNDWRDKFNKLPFEDFSGTKPPRFYQEVAVTKALTAIANKDNRILLTLATGTGKTFIAFQIAWKLFHTRWNLQRNGERRPRILFLADRNILAGQAMNDFHAFDDDVNVRISPSEISKKGRVPTNGNIFFTIFQTFMSGKENTPHFGQYPSDFFDLIIIDECHRGGANDEGSWRGILEYFSPAVQIGLTATPKRKTNADTYRYFGEPKYIYSLKEGINDGYLTPFKVKRIQTTIDKYIYTSDDSIIEGEIEEGKEYTESEFNKIIEIKERENYRVKVVLDQINQNEKTIIFCANQEHALAVRDAINQNKKSTDINYCHRVTANDGKLGEQHLADFQDNEKTIPTILTTSQKLSTGVDARNVRNIVLLRPVNSMVEFKQIVGRGTRLFDGKNYFTIYDFVDAYHHFADPEWDGEPIEEEACKRCGQKPCACITEPPEPCQVCGKSPCICELPEPEPCSECGKVKCVCGKRMKIKIKLRNGKEREFQNMTATSFWSPEGRPISAEEYLQSLYGKLPEFFKDEDELRNIWSNPETRASLLGRLEDAGYGKDELSTLTSLCQAENSDLFDVLEYISFEIKPITREERAKKAEAQIFNGLDECHKEFLEFVLSKYIECGVEELGQEKLPELLELKYHSISDASDLLGGVDRIRESFIGFQKYLYGKDVA